MPAQREFFDELNAGLQTFCEFRANNIFHVFEQQEEFSNCLQALIIRTETVKEELKNATGIAKLRLIKEASALKV